MKQMKTKWWQNFCLVCLVLTALFILCPESVQAAENEKVMTITVKNKYGSATTDIYAQISSYGGTSFIQKESPLNVFTGATDGTVRISVKNVNTDIIVQGSVKSSQKVKLKEQWNSIPISFSYYQEEDADGDDWDGEAENGVLEGSIDLNLYCDTANPQVESLWLSAGSKGFHPSDGNFMRVKSGVTLAGSDMRLRMRIYNAEGKYVFQKVFKDVYWFLDYKWNGKASNKNEAGVKAGKYVSDGRYKVEIYTYFKSGKTEVGSKKTKSFKVSSRAAAGAEGLKQARTIPVYTGDAEIDYMAEDMCKKAGITSGMGSDEKVRRIYHWMTQNFKHLTGNNDVYKEHYNLNALKKKINSYKKKTDKLLKDGKILYGYKQVSTSSMVYYNGVCTNHAQVFRTLCNHAGVESGVCSGYYLNRNGTKAGHSWNYAVIGGITYYYDVDVEIQNYGKGQGDYYWYKKILSEAKKTHEFHATE